MTFQKKSIANRLSTFYNTNETTAKTVNKYTGYIYRSIFFLILGILIYNIVMGGTLTKLYEKSTALVLSGISTVADKSVGVKKMKGGAITDAIAKVPTVNPYSLRVWIIILSVFILGYYVIVPYIIKPLTPYLAEYGVYILLTTFLILIGDFFYGI